MVLGRKNASKTKLGRFNHTKPRQTKQHTKCWKGKRRDGAQRMCKRNMALALRLDKDRKSKGAAEVGAWETVGFGHSGVND